MSDAVRRNSADVTEWIFTFGFDHAYPRHFVRIRGTWLSARLTMLERFGRAWAFQYASEEDAGVEKHGLVELVYFGDDAGVGSQQASL